MDHNSVVEVPADSSAQHHAFEVLALPDHVLHTIPVRNPGDGLFNDGSRIELSGRKVGRGTNDFHSPLVGPVVGPGALKGGQE